jgi:hypothetical protein
MPALLLALTGLDRAAMKLCTAFVAGILLVFFFAVSSIAALFGPTPTAGTSPGVTSNGGSPLAFLAPPQSEPSLPFAPLSGPDVPLAGAQGNAVVLRALMFVGSQRWLDGWGESLCEQFVENMYGTTGQYPSAIAAWQALKPADPKELERHRDLTLAPVGSKIYFFDPHQPYGHTGIYAGNGAFIAANDYGVQAWNVDAWMAATGQSFLGWVAP